MGISLALAHTRHATLWVSSLVSVPRLLVGVPFLSSLPSRIVLWNLACAWSSKAALEVRLSKRWPALPQPGHLRVMKVFLQILPIEHDQLYLFLKHVITGNLDA